MEEVLFREKKYPIRKGEKQDGKGNELSKNVISREVCLLLAACWEVKEGKGGRDGL